MFVQTDLQTDDRPETLLFGGTSGRLPGGAMVVRGQQAQEEAHEMPRR